MKVTKILENQLKNTCEILALESKIKTEVVMTLKHPPKYKLKAKEKKVFKTRKSFFRK